MASSSSIPIIVLSDDESDDQARNPFPPRKHLPPSPPTPPSASASASASASGGPTKAASDRQLLPHKHTSTCHSCHGHLSFKYKSCSSPASASSSSRPIASTSTITFPTSHSHSCSETWCYSCLDKLTGKVLHSVEKEWKCPACSGTCPCTRCSSENRKSKSSTSSSQSAAASSSVVPSFAPTSSSSSTTNTSHLKAPPSSVTNLLPIPTHSHSHSRLSIPISNANSRRSVSSTVILSDSDSDANSASDVDSDHDNESEDEENAQEADRDSDSSSSSSDDEDEDEIEIVSPATATNTFSKSKLRTPTTTTTTTTTTTRHPPFPGYTKLFYLSSDPLSKTSLELKRRTLLKRKKEKRKAIEVNSKKEEEEEEEKESSVTDTVMESEVDSDSDGDGDVTMGSTTAGGRSAKRIVEVEEKGKGRVQGVVMDLLKRKKEGKLRKNRTGPSGSNKSTSTLPRVYKPLPTSNLSKPTPTKAKPTTSPPVPPQVFPLSFPSSSTLATFITTTTTPSSSAASSLPPIPISLLALRLNLRDFFRRFILPPALNNPTLHAQLNDLCIWDRLAQGDEDAEKATRKVLQDMVVACKKMWWEEEGICNPDVDWGDGDGLIDTSSSGDEQQEGADEGRDEGDGVEMNVDLVEEEEDEAGESTPGDGCSERSTTTPLLTDDEQVVDSEPENATEDEEDTAIDAADGDLPNSKEATKEVEGTPSLELNPKPKTSRNNRDQRDLDRLCFDLWVLDNAVPDVMEWNTGVFWAQARSVLTNPALKMGRNSRKPRDIVIGSLAHPEGLEWSSWRGELAKLLPPPKKVEVPRDRVKVVLEVVGPEERMLILNALAVEFIHSKRINYTKRKSFEKERRVNEYAVEVLQTDLMNKLKRAEPEEIDRLRHNIRSLWCRNMEPFKDPDGNTYLFVPYSDQVRYDFADVDLQYGIIVFVARTSKSAGGYATDDVKGPPRPHVIRDVRALIDYLDFQYRFADPEPELGPAPTFESTYASLFSYRETIRPALEEVDAFIRVEKVEEQRGLALQERERILSRQGTRVDKEMADEEKVISDKEKEVASREASEERRKKKEKEDRVKKERTRRNAARRVAKKLREEAKKRKRIALVKKV